jgi:hypothetical protein
MSSALRKMQALIMNMVALPTNGLRIHRGPTLTFLHIAEEPQKIVI